MLGEKQAIRVLPFFRRSGVKHLQECRLSPPSIHSLQRKYNTSLTFMKLHSIGKFPAKFDVKYINNAKEEGTRKARNV